MKMGINEYLQVVGQKLASPTATQLMQFGTRAKVRGQQMLRDDEGMMSTKSNILDIAQNFFAATQGRDELQTKFANFSTTNYMPNGSSPSTGQETVASVKTVGAIDVTILSLSTSIIPFVAIDRSMATPTATIYYNELVASNTAGGVNAGDVVSGNFNPPNMNVNLSTEVSGVSVTSGTPTAGQGKVVPGTVVVKIVSGTNSWEGKDYAQNGQILFPAEAQVSVGTVNYDTGVFSVTTGASTPTITVDFQKDVPADNTENNGALVVTPQYTPVTLDTSRDNIIVQDNLVNRMAMQKIQMIATAGAGGTSQADVLMARTKNTYIEALNRKVLAAMFNGYNGLTVSTNGQPANTDKIACYLDLFNYNVGAWANTKNDQVLQLMTNLDALFLARTGIASTAIVTSSYGVALLQCISGMWTSNPDAVNGLNGLAGYFNGKAVYRHNYLNNMQFTGTTEDSKTYQNAVPFFAVAKLPDNNSGSSVFGEYLPLTSTGVVGNFDNPQNISTGFFSQTGVKVVSENLIQLAVLIPPSGGLFSGPQA